MSTSRQNKITTGSGIAWSLGLLLLANASCQEEALSPDVLPQEQTRSVMFNIPLLAEGVESPDLQVLLYNATGEQFLTKVELTGVENQADGSQLLHGLIPVDCQAIDNDRLVGHLVVLGNCPIAAGPIEELQSLTFQANCPNLPLYGAHDVQLRMDKRLEVLCPTTQLLPSGAWVTVRLADELAQAGIALQQVTVKQVNQTGYCVPLSATQLVTSADMATALIFRPDSRTQGDVMLSARADGSMQALLPECKTPGDEPIEMELRFTRDGEAYTGLFGQKLYFKNYADNQPFDLVRGHHYIFNIRSLQTEGELEVVVEDWNEQTADDVIFN